MMNGNKTPDGLLIKASQALRSISNLSIWRQASQAAGSGGLSRFPQKLQSLFFKAGSASLAAQVPQVTVACDFGASKIVLLEVLRDHDTVKISKFHRLARPDNQSNALEAVKQCFETGGYLTRRVRISVKGQSVIVRFIRFPKMKMEELRSAIHYEAENYIPFKLNEVILDFYVLEDDIDTPSGKEMNLLLVAVKKDEIYPLVKFFQDAGLEIEFIDIDVLASLNALQFFYPEDFEKSVSFLDIGKEISSVSVLRGGKPRFIRDASYGGIDITKRLRRKLGLTEQAALEILETDRKPTPEALAVLKEGYETLVSDLKVTLDYYMSQVQLAQPIEKLFIGGGGGDPQVIVEALSKPLGIPVQGLDILGKVQVLDGVDRDLLKKNQWHLPVAMGLCLRSK